MCKTLSICVVFHYSHDGKTFHYANITVPFNIEFKELESIFEEMHDSFCDEKFYCRENDGTSDGEYLFKKVCEQNDWKYANFIEKHLLQKVGVDFECTVPDLAKQLNVEPVSYTISIWDDF